MLLEKVLRELSQRRLEQVQWLAEHLATSVDELVAHQGRLGRLQGLSEALRIIEDILREDEDEHARRERG